MRVHINEPRRGSRSILALDGASVQRASIEPVCSTCPFLTAIAVVPGVAGTVH